MKNLLKNTKSILATALAFAVLACSLFTGAGLTALAATGAHGEIDMLEFGDYLINDLGSTSKWYDTKLVDNGETGADWDNAIIIDSAEEFVYLSKQGGGGAETAGKYYKVADGIAGFNLSTNSLDITKSYDDNQAVIENGGKNHAGVTDGFQGYFDGNGVTVYGATTNKAAVSGNSALFTGVKGDVLIKNMNVTLSFFYATNVAAGIVATYTGDPVKGDKLVIENCTVTDSHIEILEGDDGRKVNGGILAFAQNSVSTADGYVNGEIIIKNCLVDLDPKHFVTPESGKHLVKGGFTGNAQTNAIRISDCVSIGIKLYPTFSGDTTAPHSANAANFSNCYTDQTLDESYAWNQKQNFDGKATKLTKSQMSGAAALDNMNLDSNIWIADDVDVPELRISHNDIDVTDNGDGTHSEVCGCGFGGVRSNHNFTNKVCACGVELNCATRETIYWDGMVASGISTGSGDKEDPYIIKTAAELAWLVQQKADVTTDKYYKIADNIGTIVLQSADKADDIMALDSAAAVKSYFENGTFSAWKTTGWEVACFAGYFDGNGATIYGLYAPSADNSALFCTVDGGSAIVNLGVKNSYFTSSANNYQVCVLFGTSSTNSYGAKREGMVWVNNCLIANNYLYNASTQYARSAIVGNSQDAITIDNTLIYGNDATYGDGVKMPVVGNRTNAILVGTTHHDGFVPMTAMDGDKELYANAIRNTISLGADLFNVEEGVGWRKNRPECFVNCFTDGKSGSIEFPNGTVCEYTEEQIKSITAADLATIALPEAFIATGAMPELKAFHDAEFVGGVYDEDNYAGHVAACSCGLATDVVAHTYEVEGEGEDATYTCSVCGFVCDHSGDESHWSEVITDPNCVKGDTYTFTCDCGFVFYDEGEALGHDFVAHEAEAGADCQTAGTIAYKHCAVCEKNYAADADVYEPFENALTDLTGENGTCKPMKDAETGDIHYEKDADNHWTVCSACNEIIETNPHTGEATSNGAEGHSLVCTVCGYASENAAHVFGDDSVCDECGYECTEHNYVDGETNTLYWECTPEACQEVEQICSLCGHVGTPRTIGHTEGDWIAMPSYRDMNYVGTCTSDGQHTEVQQCAVCQYYEFGTRIVSDAKTGHSFTEYEATEATCTFEGNIAYKQCEVCWNRFALDAAYDEAYENALTDEEVYIAVDPENHDWVEYASTATCDEDGIAAHKFCKDCYIFVIGEEATDLAIDWDAYYACDDETGAPIGIGAKLDAALGAIENKAFADFIAENYADAEIEVPEYPDDPNDWEAMNAYNDEYYAIWDELFVIDENWQEAWGEYWAPIVEELQTEAYHEAFLLAAATAEVDMTATATGHAYDNACDAECNNGCGTVREVPDHVYDNDDDMNCNECGAERVFAWNISVGVTGTYTITPNDAYTAEFDAADIVVLDKNGNEVKATENGYPLVKDVVYTIELVNNDFLKDIDGVFAWDLTKEDAKLFPDTNNGDWYGDAVNYVVGAGIMSGYASNGKFGTSDSIQRQDFIVMLARYAGADLTAYDYDCALKDVAANGYYKAAINWALAMGITTGYDDGTFGVGDKMTREQLVTFLYRYANIIGVDTTVDADVAAQIKAQYGDFGKVSPFSTDAIVWALSKGVISGQGGVKVDPQGGAQRCQVAQIMYNIFANDIFAI